MDLAALMGYPPLALPVFLLILVRSSAIFLGSPVLGNQMVPIRFKLGLAFMLAAIATPLMLAKGVPVPDLSSIWGLLAAIASELALGLVIAFGAQMLFTSMQFAGQLVGLQMGFGMANVYDPGSQAQVTVTAQFFTTLGMLLFLIVDGHHWIIAALMRSYEAVPLGAFRFAAAPALSFMLDAVSQLFVVSLGLAAPLLGVLFLGELALGFVARIMPQMNVFVAAFPVKILLGFATLLVALPMIGAAFEGATETTFTSILSFVGLSGGPF